MKPPTMCELFYGGLCGKEWRVASDQWLARDQGLSPGAHKGLYPVIKHMRGLGGAVQVGSGCDLIAAPGRPRANGPAEACPETWSQKL